ncbi:MAG TPA: hypothetical protein VHB45_00895 [Alloacidobacterium sp.]|nr:hypothetical protein [Alloacidobacterium sp.]
MRISTVFLCALLLSGCAYARADDTLQTLHGKCSIAPATEPDHVQFKLESDTCEENQHHCNMDDSEMSLGDFSGFSLTDLKRDGAHIDAVVAAEAGKLTCAGTVHDLALRGDYTFVPDPAFVARMRQMGFSNLDSNKLQAYTLFHIETSWVQSLQSAGVKGLDSDKLLAMRIFKIDAAFVKNMDALGYPDLSAGKLIAFKIHGVNAEEVKQLRAMGYQPTADELIQMRIFKVTPDFIHRMQDRGMNNLTIAKLVQIRIFKLAE